jgi:hypothetical protein
MFDVPDPHDPLVTILNRYEAGSDDAAGGESGPGPLLSQAMPRLRRPEDRVERT